MATSTKMLAERSNATMPSTVWLHVNGVSITTEIQHFQPPIHSYDYRTKHLQSPVQSPTPPLVSPPNIVPCSITVIDGPYSNNTTKKYQKLEHLDIPKKMFIDRHIKKAKSLPGLIKGTALSRQTPLQSSSFTSPAPPNPLIQKIPDDQLPTPNATIDSDDIIIPLPQPIENHHEIRRPRVNFADFNKIQFIEDNNTIAITNLNASETCSQHSMKRRHRHRIPKKTSNTQGSNFLSPSIQQTQVLQQGSPSLSHPQNPHFVQELSIKKQQLVTSQRANLSRSPHLPDLNQSISAETSFNDNSSGKYVLQREKPLYYVPKPAPDPTLNSSVDNMLDNSRITIAHPSPVSDIPNQIFESEASENSNTIFFATSSSLSSTSNNRNRSLLQTISLRQQFNSPVRTKATGPATSITFGSINSQQQTASSKLNPHRSNSLKNPNMRAHEENDDINVNKYLTTTDSTNRPITANGTNRRLKRSDAIHYHTKNPFGNSTANDSNEATRHISKTHLHEINQERFQNLLTVVRPPYATNNNGSVNISPSTLNPDSTKQTQNQSPTKAHLRMSRSTSARGTTGFHVMPNIITV